MICRASGFAGILMGKSAMTKKMMMILILVRKMMMILILVTVSDLFQVSCVLYSEGVALRTRHRLPRIEIAGKRERGSSHCCLYLHHHCLPRDSGGRGFLLLNYSSSFFSCDTTSMCKFLRYDLRFDLIPVLHINWTQHHLSRIQITEGTEGSPSKGSSCVERTRN